MINFIENRGKSLQKIIKQKNVGQNHYDMFDFIFNNYDNLPEVTIFCRACLFFPKAKWVNNGWQKWRPSPERCESTGNFNEVDFEKVCNNTDLTELHDFGAETIGLTSKLDTDNHGFLEMNNNWYFGQGKSKYFRSLNDFFCNNL